MLSDAIKQTLTEIYGGPELSPCGINGMTLLEPRPSTRTSFHLFVGNSNRKRNTHKLRISHEGGILLQCSNDSVVIM